MTLWSPPKSWRYFAWQPAAMILKERLGRIVIGYKSDKVTPVYARDLNAQGAMAALVKRRHQT